MKDEALKQVLEAITQYLAESPDPSEEAVEGLCDAASAARKALAQPAQEPVAVKHMMEWVDYLKRKSDYGQHMKIPSEMSAGDCWELAIELEQFINTTPPQRTWFGLTPQERDEINEQVYGAVPHHVAFHHAIEAKLRSKNG